MELHVVKKPTVTDTGRVRSGKALRDLGFGMGRRSRHRDRNSEVSETGTTVLFLGQKEGLSAEHGEERGRAGRSGRETGQGLEF